MATYNAIPGSDLDLLDKTFRWLSQQEIAELAEQFPAIITDVRQMLEVLLIEWVEDASGFSITETLKKFEHIISQNITVKQIQADM